jgi:rhodanese-related sulfurtransferase
MVTRIISYQEALRAQRKGNGVIIDVREPAEYRDGHVPYAVNLPSTSFSAVDYQKWKHLEIYLVCQSGDRTRTIAQQLHEAGLFNVSVLNQHMEQIDTEATSEIWSVDRQFRFLLGILIALYLIGHYWLSDAFAAIPVILCTGLIITAIIDKCYLRVGIAMLPWNRAQANGN